jgi:Meckel syndrome type 1 protein
VKRAYRRLAKAFHPDSAGPAALPRFLAIHAAYEQIATGRVLPGAAGPREASSGPREPWRADPARARATRRGAAADRADQARTRPPERDGSEAGRGERASRSGRRHATRKATLGSTSYDDARDRSDATWGGASWYGPTTGEYWIINPREYADPRKHGPAYQARVRQRLEEAAAREPGADDAGAEAGAAEAAADETGGREAAADERPDRPASGAAATGNWQGRTEAVRRQPPAHHDREAAHVATGEVGPRAWPDREPIVGPADDPSRRFRLALIAWPPLGVAAAIALGDVTGCAVYAASCSGAAPLLPWLAQAVILALLLLLQPLARLLAVGTVAVLLALVPATAVLLVLGAAGHPQAAFALGSLLALAWLVGVLAGAVSAVRGTPLFSAR